MILNNNKLAKEICSPIGYSFLVYLQDKYGINSHDILFEKFTDNELFNRYYQWVKTNKQDLFDNQTTYEATHASSFVFGASKE
jgi:hypothetical protein